MPPQNLTPATPDLDDPVAFDREGHPLYRHPEHETVTPPPAIEMPPVPQTTPSVAGGPDATPQVAYPTPVAPPAEMPAMPAPATPVGELTPAQQHEASIKKYPWLNLSEDEYVIAEISRDPIGLAQIWGGGLALMIAFALISFGPNINGATKVLMIIGFAIMSVAVIFGVLLISRIYKGNHLYLTNESVILETQSSLYKKDEKTVNLSGIDDVSFVQSGFMANSFNYGTLKLTIEGEDSDYHFSNVGSPKRQADLLHNQIEKFKKVHA